MILSLAATTTFGWAVWEDLRTRKFSNRSFLIISACALILAVTIQRADFWHFGLVGFLSGFALLLPLVILKIVGGGDLKLMAAAGLLIGWNGVFWTVAYGMIWAAIFGLYQVFARGEFKQLTQNLSQMATTRSSAGIELHKLPFTVPLLLGWLTHATLEGLWR
ncbi:MAG TPA: A24 family peptidase [Pseudobdellovibrionaceae bacterium]|nr:A24 family peptidase [Pseudobdellovibrionaceae bacterium]